MKLGRQEACALIQEGHNGLSETGGDRGKKEKSAFKRNSTLVLKLEKHLR